MRVKTKQLGRSCPPEKSRLHGSTFPRIAQPTLHPVSEQSDWRPYLIQLAPIVLVYLVLATYQLENQSLWTDEVLSVKRAASGLPILSQLLQQNSLYYILLGLWVKTVGSSEVALRALSIVLGLVAVCVTHALAFRLFNRRVAMFAAILLATSPYFIWYAQEVRYVVLMLVTSLLSTYSFYRAISGGDWRWWLTYTTISIVALLSFVTVIFLIAAHGLYILCSAYRRPLLRKWMAFQLASFLFFAIWYIVGTGPYPIGSSFNGSSL